MGTFRSASDCTGLHVNGITLGEPTFTDAIPPLEAEPLMFAWDDSRLPNGVIEDDGSVTLDETEVV
jgi:hypothetical protein